MKCSSFIWIAFLIFGVFFALKFSLSEIAITTPAFSSLLLAWHIFFYSFTSSLFAFLCFWCVSCVTWLDLTLPSYCVLYICPIPFSPLFCHLDKLTIFSFQDFFSLTVWKLPPLFFLFY